MAQADPGRHHRATTREMERVTIRIEEDNLKEIEELVEDGEYPNRSEAIRDSIKGLLNAEAIQTK